MTDFYMPQFGIFIFFVLSSICEAVAQAVCKSRGLGGCSQCVGVLYTGTLLRRNVVLKFTAKRNVLANTLQCVGRGKECVIKQRNQNTDISSHIVSKEKC